MIEKVKTRQDLIDAYINFFREKKHKHIPSSSLIPENDPTVLFTTAGMHPLVPFLLGQKHPLGKRLCSVQKCIRTQDIDEVGDEVHHTFFEMLGNWSLGDYFKKEAIEFSFEFLTKVLNLPVDKLAVTCFGGDKRVQNLPVDKEGAEIWIKLGLPKERISFLEGGVFESKKNWWGPAGETGPCGPDTEIFYWKYKKPAPKSFNPDDENWVEIWNDVFMQYEKTKAGAYVTLKQKNVDTGMGVERTLAVLNGLEDNYQSSIFQPIIKEIEKMSGQKYSEKKREMRIIADHLRASVFILGDVRTIKPSNVGQGYVLRRLIRRAIRYGRLIGIKENFTSHLSKSILPIFPDYQELHTNHKFIAEQLEEEENKFNATLEKGLKKFNELGNDKLITGKEAFLLFQSYGFPIEMTQELADEKGIKIDLEEYNGEFKRHQDLSRTSSAGMFKSGLADDSEATKKLHTATHLLNEALRQVLSKDIRQKGSNITPERLRFDFNFPRKLSSEEIKKLENWINDKIKAALKVRREEIPLRDALSSGAQSEFGAKYPELVSVYTIEDKRERKGWISKEICTGPHVENTSELGNFKIIKEESSASGIRRIKAELREE
ncbi:alanine--tRNA ligase [Candidatus Pacearchaeota archaeon]|nr:alanine--tRNA ligase [Candidatus Pacearchaeota archaeon]